MQEDESFLEAKARKKKGQRGKSAQDLVQEVLEQLYSQNLDFDFDRLYDTKSCGRPIPQQVADFVGVYKGKAFALEVKEITAQADLARGSLAFSKFDQYSRMMRRSLAGGLCVLVVKAGDVWFITEVQQLCPPTGRGSWNLPDFSRTVKHKLEPDSLLYLFQSLR